MTIKNIMKYNFCTFLDKPQRVDIYISALFSDYSRSYVQKMIDRWQVSINNIQINKNLKIKNRDEIKIEIKLESLDIIAEKPEKGNLDIIFEDNEIVIVNKEPWVNVHPVPWEFWNSWTLVNFLLEHCKNKLPNIGWIERPWIVHRLDKNTSWLIMVAKSDKMMNYLSNTFKERNIDKYYIAIVTWTLKDKKIKIESFIGRDPNDRQKMTTQNPVNPKIAITNAELLWIIDNNFSVLRVKIETWRTHQIRVHLASIWFPIIWDPVYWNKRVNKEVATKYQIKRQALHAHEVNFNLYWKLVNFKAELKEDMKNMIDKIYINKEKK
jgi:23S rRNA pseudouridine1911/1915/1917 synthase